MTLFNPAATNFLVVVDKVTRCRLHGSSLLEQHFIRARTSRCICTRMLPTLGAARLYARYCTHRSTSSLPSFFLFRARKMRCDLHMPALAPSVSARRAAYTNSALQCIEGVSYFANGGTWLFLSLSICRVGCGTPCSDTANTSGNQPVAHFVGRCREGVRARCADRAKHA